MINPLELTQQLVRQPSITPNDAHCQNIVSQLLHKQGFVVESLPFEKVRNMWAIRGDGNPCIIFAGHTDVVPAGNTDHWQFPPFSAHLANGKIYGRGVADMKGSIAAFISALDTIEQKKGSIGILLTSDEEGEAIHGTNKVVQLLQARGIHADYVLVGEPSSHQKVGDTIRIGRRGSLSASITLSGKSGHVAYPQTQPNPINIAAHAIASLYTHKWDTGDKQFPPTSVQFTNIHSESGATNVTPATITTRCNFRYSPALHVHNIQHKVTQAFTHPLLSTNIQWIHSASPFVCPPGDMRSRAKKAIAHCCGYEPTFSTAGGTSDGRFLIAMCKQLIELGPTNATIHQVNECLAIDEIYRLQEIYAYMLNDIVC